MTRSDVDPSGLPDFIIIGAQKSGTSSLHHLLASHPSVFIPDGEVFFFDVDDREQHPDFFDLGRGLRAEHNWERDFDDYLAWYRSFFRAARPDQRIGEDSTTYLASRLAPARVAATLPNVRLLAVLRDPVQRAYSHYWHGVSTGRQTTTFEEAIRDPESPLVARGNYAAHLSRWRDHFDPSSLLVVLFEDFVARPQAVFDAALKHIGVEDSLDVSTLQGHRNAASPPLSVGLRLALNRLAPALFRKSYAGRLPRTPGYRSDDPSRGQMSRPAADAQALLDRWRTRRRYPPMSDAARTRLQEHFRSTNSDLARLVAGDPAVAWPWMR